MAIQRTVWTLGDCRIKIFREDGVGGLEYNTPGQPLSGVAPAFFEYCFAENVTITATTVTRRRGVTGRGFRKITNPSQTYDDVTAEIDHLLFRKATEIDWTQIFNPARHLRFVFDFYKLEYTNVAPFENDTFYLSYARARSFVLKSKMPDEVTASISIDAELIL